MHFHSTLKATLLDRLHEQASARETAFILAQSPRATFTTPALTVRQVRETFTFQPCEFRTLRNANGQTTQAAMEVTDPANPADRFIVMFGGETDWTAECPRGRHEFAATVIAAVQERIAGNRRMKGGAN